ncbi:hypothetical protein ACFXPS_17870 [Nocardia sp. NPDC059091]|uniref:hypothetical protein n=1 Tax=Nocardia sp. NPDC059091 TaxID=3346724 RepID=UPI0036C6222A
MTDPWTYGETDPSEEFVAQMEAAYGPNWPTELMNNLRFDTSAEPVELPPPDREIIMARRVFLRLPWSMDKQLEVIGRNQGLTPSELVSTWIAERLGEHGGRAGAE